MKNLIFILLTCAAVLGQTRPAYYDANTRNFGPTDLDFVGTSGNFVTLQQNGVVVVTTARALTLAGTANEISVSAGAQTLAADRTWTFSLPAALTFTGKTITGGTFSSPTLTTPTIASFLNATHDHSNAAGGGNLTPTALGLSDPNADRILFWDDSAGAFTWLTAGSGLSISGTTITATGGGSGGVVGSMINSGASVQYNFTYYTDDTGTNMAPALVGTDSTLTNFYAGGFYINSLVVTNDVTLNNLNITTNLRGNFAFFTNSIDIANADTTISRASAGDIAVEGNRVFRVGGADVPVADGGTGLGSGTSGGILGFTASGTLASSAALAANAIVIGGGAGATPTTTTTAAGILTFIGTPSSANFASAITGETGTGAVVFGTQPTIDLGSSMTADDTAAGFTRSGRNNSGGVTQWDAVYLNASSQWVLADANGTGTYPCRGIVTATVATGNATTVITRGTIRNDAWTWTPGGAIYLSTTAGALTQTAPSTTGDKVQVIGYALDADTMAVEISTDYGTAP